MNDRATALERLLREERELILSGRFDALGALAERKAAALARLPETPPAGPRLSALVQQLDRNQALLDAAIRGVAAARARIQTVIGAAGSLSTYDSRGLKSDIGQPRGDLRKKA